MNGPERSIAIILNQERTAGVGLAFLFDDRLVLTCAHVVNASLGRPLDAAEAPDDVRNVRIPLDFSLLGSPDDWFDLSAKIAEWLPRSGDLYHDDDIAILQLGQDLRSAGAVPLDIGAGQPDAQARLRMWGTSLGRRNPGLLWVDGDYSGRSDKFRLRVTEVDRKTLEVHRGFSGSPVVDVSTMRVVGMVQGIDHHGPGGVYTLAGEVLRSAIAALSRRTELIIVHDHGEIHYNGRTYTLKQSRLMRNDSGETYAWHDARISVDRLPNHDPQVSSTYHDQHPLVAEDLGIKARCAWRDDACAMSWSTFKSSNKQVDLRLEFPEGRDLRPGQSTRLWYSYNVSDQQWGQWYQRNVRANTDRLSVEAHLPTHLEPECWGMTTLPSRPGLEPLSQLVKWTSGARTTYSWDRTSREDDLRQGRRVRLEWFFWKRVLDSDSTAQASDAMRQFGIRQIRGPTRGMKSPPHILGQQRIRSVELDSDGGRELAQRILGHLRRVADWVATYHSFAPDVRMGLAAPQLGIAYRIAIVQEDQDGGFIELVNPAIVGQSSETADEFEGCFCFFDFRGIVRRPVGVTVSYDSIDGGSRTDTFDGALARSVQHEVDHLNGKLYTDHDRMPAGTRLIPIEEYRASLPGAMPW